MDDLGWVSETLETMRQVLCDRDVLAQHQELASAKVSASAIASLYPLDPLDYRAGITALMSTPDRVRSTILFLESVDALGMAERFAPEVEGDVFTGGRGLSRAANSVVDSVVPFAIDLRSRLLQERNLLLLRVSGLYALPRLLDEIAKRPAAQFQEPQWRNIGDGLRSLKPGMERFRAYLLSDEVADLLSLA